MGKRKEGLKTPLNAKSVIRVYSNGGEEIDDDGHKTKILKRLCGEDDSDGEVRRYVVTGAKVSEMAFGKGGYPKDTIKISIRDRMPAKLSGAVIDQLAMRQHVEDARNALAESFAKRMEAAFNEQVSGATISYCGMDDPFDD